MHDAKSNNTNTHGHLKLRCYARRAPCVVARANEGPGAAPMAATDDSEDWKVGMLAQLAARNTVQVSPRRGAPIALQNHIGRVTVTCRTGCLLRGPGRRVRPRGRC